MSNNLTITITGGIHSGKTILANQIGKCLAGAGIQVTMSELEMQEVAFLDLEPAFERLCNDGLGVHIETAQLTRAGLMPGGRVPECPVV